MHPPSCGRLLATAIDSRHDLPRPSRRRYYDVTLEFDRPSLRWLYGLDKWRSVACVLRRSENRQTEACETRYRRRFELRMHADVVALDPVLISQVLGSASRRTIQSSIPGRATG